MHYIILDLEWNQAQNPDENIPELTFEIIEIGAIKLDENMRMIGKFDAVIKPQVYRKLHYRIREITKMKKEELAHGRNFKAAAADFLKWCGDDFMFCTWGSMDLTELQRNMEYFGVENTLKWPLFYYDIQKLYGLAKDGNNSGKALQKAVEELGLDMDVPFHRADADTYYTMRVMQQLNMEDLGKMISVDYFRLPDTREDELHLKFDTYDKFVSRTFASPEAAMRDKEVLTVECPFCGELARRRVPWFAGNGHNYFCAAWCPEHGWLRGKARVRRHFDGLIYVVRTVRAASEDEVEGLIERQNTLREKRRVHRHQVNMRQRRASGSGARPRDNGSQAGAKN